MNFKFKHTDKIVGAFLILAVALLLATVIFLVYNQKIFSKKYYFTTRFNDANGLKINQDILFKGFKIGKISKITLNENNQVDADFFIYDQYIDKVKVNSVMNKASNPLTGSRIVFIPNSINRITAKEHSFMPSLDLREGQMLVAMGEVEKQADAISNIINDVETILNSINSDRNPQANSLARILVNAADIVESIHAEMKSLDEIMANIKTLSGNVKNPEGLVQRLIDPTGDIMFNSIRGSLINLEDMLKELSEFAGFINSQSNRIETILVDGKSTLKSAQDVVESVKNNPLIKGGIREKQEQEAVKESIRDRDF